MAESEEGEAKLEEAERERDEALAYTKALGKGWFMVAELRLAEAEAQVSRARALLSEAKLGEAKTRAAQQPMEHAPRDGTMVWLLIDYSDGGGPLVDAQCAWTIGFNNFDNDGEDVWKFTGWSWSQDCFCEGSGQPVAWKPIGFELEADAPSPTDAAKAKAEGEQP